MFRIHKDGMSFWSTVAINQPLKYYGVYTTRGHVNRTSEIVNDQKVMNFVWFYFAILYQMV